MRPPFGFCLGDFWDLAELSNEDERAKSLAEATEGAFDVDSFRLASKLAK